MNNKATFTRDFCRCSQGWADLVASLVVRGRRNPLHTGFALRLTRAREAADMTGASLSLAVGMHAGNGSRFDQEAVASCLAWLLGRQDLDSDGAPEDCVERLIDLAGRAATYGPYDLVFVDLSWGGRGGGVGEHGFRDGTSSAIRGRFHPQPPRLSTDQWRPTGSDRENFRGFSASPNLGCEKSADTSQFQDPCLANGSKPLGRSRRPLSQPTALCVSN